MAEEQPKPIVGNYYWVKLSYTPSETWRVGCTIFNSKNRPSFAFPFIGEVDYDIVAEWNPEPIPNPDDV